MKALGLTLRRDFVRPACVFEEAKFKSWMAYLLAELTSFSCMTSRTGHSAVQLKPRPSDWDKARRRQTWKPVGSSRFCTSRITAPAIFNQYYHANMHRRNDSYRYAESHCGVETVNSSCCHRCWKVKQQGDNWTLFPHQLPPHLFPLVSHPPFAPPLLLHASPPYVWPPSRVGCQQQVKGHDLPHKGLLPSSCRRWELSSSLKQRLRKQGDITHLSTPTIHPGGFQNTSPSVENESKCHHPTALILRL